MESETSGPPQGRPLLDSLSLSTSSGLLPVELEGSRLSGPNSPTFHEETSRRSGRPIKRKKFGDDELVVTSFIHWDCHAHSIYIILVLWIIKLRALLTFICTLGQFRPLSVYFRAFQATALVTLKINLQMLKDLNWSWKAERWIQTLQKNRNMSTTFLLMFVYICDNRKLLDH